MNIYTKLKPYPYGYAQNVVDIIDLITMSKGDPKYFKINGSAGIASQAFYGDYDLYEMVDETIFKKNITMETFINKVVERLQDIIKILLKTTLIYIGDIKSGEIPEWNVKDIDELKELYKKKFISKKEFLTAIREIKCLSCNQSRRFGVIRWKPEEILQGYKILRDGSKYTLYDGISSKKGITKIDIVGYVNNKFTEFSVIYNFKYKGENISDYNYNIINLISESSMISYLEGKYFKVIKRLFSIARIKNNKNHLELLNKILNSDLGRLYNVIGDISSLLYLFEHESNLPLKRIESEIQEFRSRLANIYTLTKWFRFEDYVLKEIYKIQFLKTNEDLYNSLTKIKDILTLILNYHTLEQLIKYRICVYGCNDKYINKLEKNTIIAENLEEDNIFNVILNTKQHIIELKNVKEQISIIQKKI
jgi:hypothetical protein